MDHVFAGIDIGGTTVKIAFIQEDGSILDKWEIPTDKTEKGKHILRDIAASVNERKNTLDGLTLKGAGVGAPGYIDVDHGVIVEAVNLGWKDYKVADILRDALEIPVFVDNDANLAAAGEKWLGAGDNANNLLAVTLGTGVGGGILAGGEIIHGHAGLAGEIGHITSVKDDGAPCNCGKKGCLETVSSATGIARLGTEAASEYPDSSLHAVIASKDKLEAKDVFAEAGKGDQAARKVVQESMEHLGFALANLCNSFNPQVVVIGGGVSKAGKQLIDAIRPSFNRFAIPKIADETDMVIATLGNDAGVIGGAWLARQKLTAAEAG
ncbi:ROK family glucokinase [Salisediminibacterium selenitireducens]|uniref:Glucokinase n=1 Tax=Bacillus selenitireducens (strain ATCC 700615 / DSM 15326 / MLS10) TaxID=439292 RepID=D6XW56_BACIE|nr:ROK family glucokinase [Salisediminibacterium selenitireducens]ADH99810.1 glucokinase, ROK family [[Bacillus] selenitireducens MLS10]